MNHQKPITNIARHTKRLYWHLLKKGRYEHSLKALELRMKLKKLDICLDTSIDLNQYLHQLDVQDIPPKCLERWNTQILAQTYL